MMNDMCGIKAKISLAERTGITPFQGFLLPLVSYHRAAPDVSIGRPHEWSGSSTFRAYRDHYYSAQKTAGSWATNLLNQHVIQECSFNQKCHCKNSETQTNFEEVVFVITAFCFGYIKNRTHSSPKGWNLRVINQVSPIQSTELTPAPKERDTLTQGAALCLEKEASEIALKGRIPRSFVGVHYLMPRTLQGSSANMYEHDTQRISSEGARYVNTGCSPVECDHTLNISPEGA